MQETILVVVVEYYTMHSTYVRSSNNHHFLKLIFDIVIMHNRSHKKSFQKLNDGTTDLSFFFFNELIKNDSLTMYKTIYTPNELKGQLV